jgi:hypothetical protein
MKEYADLPGWEFEIDEVSAGVYEVVGRDAAGHRVSAKGSNLDDLLGNCRNAAREIGGKNGRESGHED